MKLIIASHNMHKIRELKAMLKPLSHLDIFSLLDFPQYTPPEENGTSFEENAILKATHAATHLNAWALSDDSGLVVPALSGQPGIFSRRYAGEKATDRDNRLKLLKEMARLDSHQRDGYFECWIALASPQQLEACARGISEGTILESDKGSSGFGYDSLFLKHGYSKTFAELEESIKNKISHRRKALDKLLPVLDLFRN